MTDPIEALNNEYRRAIRAMPNARPPDVPQPVRRDGWEPIALTPGLLRACEAGARAGGTRTPQVEKVVRVERTIANAPWVDQLP